MMADSLRRFCSRDQLAASASWLLTSSKYLPLNATSSSCVPLSAISPFSITIIWSAFFTVLSRWATTTTVPTSKKLVQVLNDNGLVTGIERIGCLVEQQYARIFVNGPRYEDALLSLPG